MDILALCPVILLCFSFSLLAIATPTTKAQQSNSMLKSVKQILRKPSPHWVGDGFHVYPVFSNKAFSKELSPFLMFDYGKPKYYPPTTKKLGVGKHPHRGFETVTIAFQGEVEHGDNKGNKGVIGQGDVQWMTAAKGIIHEEFHSRKFAKNGGILEMCQLWVNLPKKHKLAPPRYQPILSKDIPSSPLYIYNSSNSNSYRCIHDRDDGSDIDSTCSNIDSPDSPSGNDNGFVRVIAGRFKDVIGPAKTFSQIDMFDINIHNASNVYEFDTVKGNNVIIFVRSGKVRIQNDQILGPQDVVLMNREDENTKIVIESLDSGDLKNDEERNPAKILLLAGEPFINEPIASHGPFVMNTQSELRQAFDDYNNGRF
jgi:quercetin 2,3-dioxygenase